MNAQRIAGWSFFSIGCFGFLSMFLYGAFGLYWWMPIGDNEPARGVILFMFHTAGTFGGFAIGCMLLGDSK